MDSQQDGLPPSIQFVRTISAAVKNIADKKPVSKKDANKSTNEWFRWNLLWFIAFCVFFIPLPLWLYPLHCSSGFVILLAVNVWSCLTLLYCVTNASITMFKLYRYRSKNFMELYPHVEEGKQDLTHMIVMCGYKEPINVMMATLDSLKLQTVVKRLFVVVGLEEGTPDFDTKAAGLNKTYDSVFAHFMVTRHPRNVAGEIPGKCSNSNYATREAVIILKELNMYNLSTCTVTTCDTDNVFPPKYFEYLGYDFLKSANRVEVVWQAPLFYNYHLDERPFFVRVTGILRAMFMMGYLIPQNINTMSVFSMSLELVEKSDYFHAGYQMDDIINNVKRMTIIKRLVRIRLVPFPVVSGPTSGETLKQEVVEWARQARRWTIGAAEVFHYFCVKFRRFHGLSGLFYGIIFTHYYGFVICAMSLFSVVGMISTTFYNNIGVCEPQTYFGLTYLAYLPFLGTAFSYVVFAWMFCLDRLGTKLLGINEKINVFRNAFHWISTPFVLLAYSCVEYYAIVEVALFGKKVCKHGASKKNGLVKV